jgi:hypothetical protein
MVAAMRAWYSNDELLALGEDIKKNGLRMPIVLWAPNAHDRAHELSVLDGRNRLDAMELVGIQTFSYNPPMNYEIVFSFAPHSGGECVIEYGGDPYEFVVSANLARRQLTQEQKRDTIAKLLKARPNKSDRQIATALGVDHKTVGRVRRDREPRGEIPSSPRGITG